MEIQYVYQKKRSDFGRQCLFNDKGPDLIDNFPSNKALLRNYISKDPVLRGSECVPLYAEHSLNTMRAEFATTAMNHIEGGWPRDVNINDEEQTKRYRRKVEKDDNFNSTIMQLCRNMENCILQNNAINIYQQYFLDLESTPLVEKSTARTVNVYQDQSFPTRPVTHISWSPDNQTKMAISHCNLVYQEVIPNQTYHSYIWEIENPNRPLFVLQPEHATVCFEYNQKDPHSLISGQLNGQVAVWDTRKGHEPVELSVMESSFRDPVHNVLWINSKSGAEFFSSSTDGQVKWWDMRKMSEPIETLILDPAKEGEQSMATAMGASCLEYDPSIATRFMVGTEQGVVFSCNRKGKTPMEKMTFRFAAHYGPVTALQRNPAFSKNFLSVGDWTAKIWSEDCRESAIMWTNFHKNLLTDGAWSPTRLSVFFLTRNDGVLDVWDILQQQKQASMSVKVCDEALRCLRTHDMGRLVAVGNQNGSTYLVEFSENLSSTNKNDKLLITSMFEREAKREKILEARNRELRLKMKTKSALALETEEVESVAKPVEDLETLFAPEVLTKVEADFQKIIDFETKVPEEIVQEEEAEIPPEVPEVPEEEPPPTPPPPPPQEEKQETKGKGKGKKGKK